MNQKCSDHPEAFEKTGSSYGCPVFALYFIATVVGKLLEKCQNFQAFAGAGTVKPSSQPVLDGQAREKGRRRGKCPKRARAVRRAAVPPVKCTLC